MAWRLAAVAVAALAASRAAHAQQALTRNALSASGNTLSNLSGWSTSGSASGVTPSAINTNDTLTFSNWWTPAKLSSTRLWLDAADLATVTAAGGQVSAWSNKAVTGSAADAVQATVGARPTFVTSGSAALNSRPAVVFDGVDDFVASPFNINGWSQMTAYAVTAVPGADMFYDFGYKDQSPGANYIRGGFFTLAGGTAVTYDGRPTAASTSYLSARSGTTVDRGSPFLGGISYTGTAASTIVAYANGVAGTPVSVPAGTPGTLISHTGTTTLAQQQMNGGVYRQTTGEFVVANTALSTTDRQTLEGYLAWKWGAQGLLRNDHPYKTVAPISSDETYYLGGNQSAAGLVFSGSASTTTLLGGTSGGLAANTMTVGSGGISVSPGVGATALGAASGGTVGLVLAASQSWTNNSAAILRVYNGVSRATGDTASRVLTVGGAGPTWIHGSIADGGAAGAVGLVKSGAGTVTLLGASTYSGGTELSAGAVSVQSDTALGTGAVTLAGAELQLGSVTLANPIALTAAQTTVSTLTSNPLNVEYLLVGGGGGGAYGSTSSRGGGGGGAGGFRTGSVVLAPDAYTVTVGGGGTRGTSSASQATGGGSSSLAGIEAAGGGKGGDNQQNNQSGGDGGSGGGATAAYGGQGNASTRVGGAGNTPFVFPSQGNNGGSAGESSGGGGGGGAGGTGSSVANGVGTGGAGGVGVAFSISGANVTYAAGGAGGNSSGAAVGQSGAANTGDGGGGGGGGTDIAGGSGGSGIVILRYLGGQVATGGVISSGTGAAAGYTIHTFKDTGSSSFTITGGTSGTATGTLSGSLTGTGGILKTGASVLVLSGSNSFTGATTVAEGSLRLGHSHALGGSTFSGGAGILDFGGLTAATFGGLAGPTNLTLANAASAAVALTLRGSGSASYSGVLSGAAGLTKTGPGTQALSGANSYSGATTISQGRLQIDPAGRINASSGVTIAGGELKYNSAVPLTAPLTFTAGVLSGTGSIGSNLALAGTAAALSPGNSPGILPLGTSQVWNSFTYVWETNAFTGTTAGVDFDQIAISGSLDLSGGTTDSFLIDLVSLTAGNAAGPVGGFSAVNRSWSIITTTGGITGFDAADWKIQTSNFTSSPSWNGTWSLAQSGNDLQLSFVAVPEPRGALLAALGAGVVAWAIRRRRASR